MLVLIFFFFSLQLIEQYEEVDDNPCEICKTIENPDKLLLCDNCDAPYHTYCLNPPLKEVPEDDWFCAECTGQLGGQNDVNVGNLIVFFFFKIVNFFFEKK